ncbi:2-oxoglutarate-dependent dioxygenase ecdK-like isoform X2 [Actinia tenebrosa]|uniref:2-oxoglutarate-dependent dioxygenase ecdK-like isoform X2 n=1 Tax=Actinia tenebrosa TaxID=6105 RepID=A0A6P8J583_ACTTE|nr:2-oxoglutarate-dependent dioxygenase ecdK-like isoform X2 [Actinia tenebrosa]
MATVEVERVSGIPMIDFSAFSIEKKTRPPAENEEVQLLVKQLLHAFSTVGFVFLKNYGISQDEIDTVFDVMDKFFNADKASKLKYSKWDDVLQNGWDKLEKESNNPDRPADLKESFDIGHIYEDTFKWPDDEVPEFKPTIKGMYEKVEILGLRILSAIALGLGMDADTFTSQYQHMGTQKGMTALRLNFYPKLKGDIDVKPEQIRCGEHTDYGGVSILFQDECGGLEVQNVEGKYIPVTPVKGAVIVNIADLMQRWTSDRLKSTFHRVIVPESIKKERDRRSAVFFFNPDRDATITCLDGQNKYLPIKSSDYITSRLASGYSIPVPVQQ